MSKRTSTDTPAQHLDYEIAQEKAAALGRLERALEAALARLRAFDVELAGGPLSQAHAAERATLVQNAGAALWHFVVQREVLGLRDSRQILRDYRVPADVVTRMGIVPVKKPSKPASRQFADQ